MKRKKRVNSGIFSDLIKKTVLQKNKSEAEDQNGANNTIRSKILSGELVPTKVAGMRNKILLYKESGKIEYISIPNVKEFKMKPDTNAYRLLYFLIMNSGRVYAYAELNKILRMPRGHIVDVDHERRVRDTVSEIRKALGSDIFYFNQGVKLSCYVEIR